MAARNYSSVARLATTTATISNSATTIPVDQTTGFPSVPFTLVLDPGRASEEAVTITGIIGNNLTAIRGVDGTPSQPHDAGAQARHMATARDFREPAEHIAAVDGVHGVTSQLVGATDSQVMDNKTFTPILTDHVPLTLQATSGQTANLMNIEDSSGNVLGSVTASGAFQTGSFTASGTSTFTAGNAGSHALVARAAASQTASILSVQDSTGAEVAGFSATGALTAATSTLASLTTTGRITSPGMDSTDQTTFTSATHTPVLFTASASTAANILTIRNGGGTVVGAWQGADTSGHGYQIYHAGGNYLPYEIHGGSQTAVIQSGTDAVFINIDFIGNNWFTAASPVFQCTVRHGYTGVQARVEANIYSLSNANATLRVYQTQGTNVPSDSTYFVHWMAFTMSQTVASG